MCTTSDVPAESHHTAKANAAKGPCFPASKEADQLHNNIPEIELSQQDELPLEGAPAALREGHMKEGKATPETILEVSQPTLVNDGSGDVEPSFNQYDNISDNAGISYKPTSETTPKPDANLLHCASTEDRKLFVPPSTFAPRVCHPPPTPPSAPSSIIASILKAIATKAPTEDSQHTIALEILIGSKVLRSIVSINACTRSAILAEARACCQKFALGDQRLRTLLTNEYSLELVSINMYDCDMDLSTYNLENLSPLIRNVEKRRRSEIYDPDI